MEENKGEGEKIERQRMRDSGKKTIVGKRETDIEAVRRIKRMRQSEKSERQIKLGIKIEKLRKSQRNRGRER